MCLNETYARPLVKQFPKSASIAGACHDWSPQGAGMSQREADHRVCFWHPLILVPQPHTSMTLGCHMDGASLWGRFFTAWVAKWSTRKECQRRKPRPCSAQSVFRSGCFHPWPKRTNPGQAKHGWSWLGDRMGSLCLFHHFQWRVVGAAEQCHLCTHPAACQRQMHTPGVQLPVPQPSPAVVQLCDLRSGCWERAGKSLTGRLSSSLGSHP